MRDGDRLSTLIDAARDAAFDDALWPDWLERLVDTFGGIGGTLFVFDPTGPDRFIPMWEGREGAVEEYAAVWAPHDSQRNFVGRLSAAATYRDTDHLDPDDPDVRRFGQWAEAAYGFGHHLGATAFAGPAAARLRIGFCIHRRAGQDGFADRHQAMLAATLPALTSAFELAFRHGEALRGAYWDGIDRRGGGEAVLLIDERGRVLCATPLARVLTGAEDGLRLMQNRLRAERPADDARIAALIGAAIAATGPVAGAARVARQSGRAPYVLVAHPLPRAQRMVAPLEAAALVTVIDPTVLPASSEKLWREAFGLTPREAEMAALLLAGHSIESAAAVLTITQPTARIHLRRLLAKTGTGRQSELVRLLGRVG